MARCVSGTLRRRSGYAIPYASDPETVRRGGVLWHFDKNIEELSDVALRKLAIQTDGTVFEGTSMEGSGRRPP